MLILTYLIVSGLLVFFIPGRVAKAVVFFYFSILVFFTSAILGLKAPIQIEPILSQVVISIIILVTLIHLPLIYGLFKVRRHEPDVKKAREIFGQHLSSLENDELHAHLKSKS